MFNLGFGSQQLLKKKKKKKVGYHSGNVETRAKLQWSTLESITTFLNTYLVSWRNSLKPQRFPQWYIDGKRVMEEPLYHARS